MTFLKQHTYSSCVLNYYSLKQKDNLNNSSNLQVTTVKNKLKQLKEYFIKPTPSETNEVINELIVSYLLLVAGVFTALMLHTLIFGGL